MDGRRFPITKKLTSKKPKQQPRRKKISSKKILSSGKQHRRLVNNNKRARVPRVKVPHFKRMVIPVDRHKIYQRRQRVNQVRTDHAPMRISSAHHKEQQSSVVDSMGDAIAKLNEDTKRISTTLNGGK